MKFKITFVFFIISIILLNVGLIYVTNINKQNNSFFRIHIVANSDSIDDQLLKYKIAKKVTEYIDIITKDSKSKNESKHIIEQNIQNILNICKTTITENGENYSVSAHIGKMSYEDKQKEQVHMRAGIYDSLKIIIGNGNGENWWSLIYPSCLNSDNELDIMSQEVKYSFGIFELFKNLF